MTHGRPFYSGSSALSYPGIAYGPFGSLSFPHSGASGFCKNCCHPAGKCCCWHRECRKESKELLVQADTALNQKTDKAGEMLQHLKVAAPIISRMGMEEVEEKGAGGDLKAGNQALEIGKAGMGNAFIGGGCCVHLSIEYTPTIPSPNVPALVFVLVRDSENTILAWVKQAGPQDGYQIKEGIITTKPGAHVTVLVLNMTARIRWCEVFSC